MYLTTIRIFVIATVFAAFIGQAMAMKIALPCNPPAETQMTLQSELAELESLAQQSHTALYESNCCEIDCCEVNCSCVGNSCSPAAAYLASNANSTNTFFQNDAVYYQQLAQPTSILTFLYRPPINALTA